MVALTDFDAAEVLALQADVERLANSEVASVVVDGEVRLTLRVGQRDIGILDANAAEVACVLRPGTWRQVSGLLDPFAQSHVDGFQWLDDTGPVKLLISSTGAW